MKVAWDQVTRWVKRWITRWWPQKSEPCYYENEERPLQSPTLPSPHFAFFFLLTLLFHGPSSLRSLVRISYSLVELTRRGVCNKRFNCMLFFNGSFRKSVYVTEHFYCFQVFREPFTKPALDCFLWKRYDCEGLDPTQNRWLWKLFPFSVTF